MSDPIGETPRNVHDPSRDAEMRSLARIYEAYYAHLVVHARALQCGDDAEDVVQQIFTRFVVEWNAPLTLTNREAIGAELTRRVRNVATKRREGEVRRRSLLARWWNGDGKEYESGSRESPAGDAHEWMHPDAAVAREELTRLYDATIAALPPRQREVYRLSAERGLSPGEIAQLLKLEPETVRKTKRAARVKIDEVLARAGYRNPTRRSRDMRGGTGEDA